MPDAFRRLDPLPPLHRREVVDHALRGIPMLAVIENGTTFITDNDEHVDSIVVNSPVGHTNVLPPLIV